MIFTPRIEGTAAIRTPASEFLAGFHTRVEAGLLTGHPPPRSRYVVIRETASHLHVSASDWWTAINVGLNEIDLHTAQAGRLQYTVYFWRWAAYGLGLCAALAAIMVAVFLALDLPDYFDRHPASLIPGPSIHQDVFAAWVMVV